MNTPEHGTANRLIETVYLDEGITVKIFDASKKLPADRWQITLAARLEIPIEALYREKPEKLPPAEDLRAALDDPLIYEHKDVRQFIDANEKTTVFESLRKNFTERVLPHIAKPRFHVNYAAMTYREYTKRQTWYPDEKEPKS